MVEHSKTEAIAAAAAKPNVQRGFNFSGKAIFISPVFLNQFTGCDIFCFSN